LAQGSGLELVWRLAAHSSRTRVLVCSMPEESLFAQRVLHAGAHGYLSKEEATSRVIEAIRHCRKRGVSPVFLCERKGRFASASGLWAVSIK
jgi:DNA-binding NarL/FixJ family response regulator